MAKDKITKTNAMRILEKNNIPYEVLSYECNEFIDGIHTADTLGIPREQCFKTLVLQGKSRQFYVFVLQIERELDLKACARVIGEKSVEMIHVKDINNVTGYIRGCCTVLGMKKQYPAVIDTEALSQKEIYVSAGRLGTQLRVSPQGLQKACQGRFEKVIMDREG